MDQCSTQFNSLSSHVDGCLEWTFVFEWRVSMTEGVSVVDVQLMAQ